MKKFISGVKRIKNGWKLYITAVRLSKSLESPSTDLDLMIKLINKSRKFAMSQQKIEIKHLLQLIIDRKPQIICEIGSYRGGTFCSFCHVAPTNATLISIDINYPVERKLAHKQFAKPDQKIKLIQGDSKSYETLERVREIINSKGIDLLFIDGDHSYEGISKDFELYYDLVSSGGIIAIHDIHPDSFSLTGVKTASYVGGVPVFWQEIKKKYMQAEEIIEDKNQDGYGLGILEKPYNAHT